MARAFLDGGARFLQLRAKHLSGAAFLETATAVVALARMRGATILVNDRADIAHLAGADGVHLGQDDLAASAARAMLGGAAMVGLSTHTVTQLEAAAKDLVDYVAIGPIFATVSKATGYDAVGLTLVREAKARAAGKPVIAIGGITLDNAPSVIAAGADAVAVIGDLLSTGDATARTRAFVARLDAES